VSTDSAKPAEVSPPSVELQTLRESQDRALHMEGIPMLIALADERGPGRNTVPAAEAVDPRHAAVLARIEHYRAALAPSQRDADMGVIASVLTVAAYEDFDRIAAP
jgi:hypothetical protein